MQQQYERATYSIPEAAQIIGIGLSLCRELVKKGEIPAKVLGRRVVIPKKALDSWLGLPNNISSNR
jgi:excisionase family DNA binding protein